MSTHPLENTTDLFDGDGHVIEDPLAIVQRLPKAFRDIREEQVRKHPAFFNLFPPLGYLSSMPFVMPSRPESHQESVTGVTGWLNFLSTVGIAGTVLYPTAGLSIGRVRDLRYAEGICRAYNDWMHEEFLSNPSGRFKGVALLPAQSPAAAAAELNRAVTELGFVAGMLPSHGLPTHLGSFEYDPIYAEADALGVPLSLHGGVHDGYGFDDYHVFAPAHALGHPFSLLISLGGMLFNGTFERFKNLRVAYLEGGSAWILLAAERFAESAGALVPPDPLCDFGGKKVNAYIKELLQSDRMVIGCEGGEEHLAYAVDYLGCAPFMYSSDYPHEVDIESCRHELEELGELGLSEENTALIRGGTARKFYGLPNE